MALIARLPDSDVFAALSCIALERGQNGDQQNTKGMFMAMVELIAMLARPMGAANRSRISRMLKDAADEIADDRNCYVDGVGQRVN